MLYRKIASLIEAHLQSGSNKILLIDGARQVGKTYIVRYVGQKLFENCWATCLSSSGTIPTTPPGSFSAMPPPSSASPGGRRTAALTDCWSWWVCPTRRTKR